MVTVSIMSTHTPLHKQIMRRVYMSYALSFLEQPLLWSGFVLGGAVALFGRFTHVASIVENTLATPLGQVPAYMTDAFLAAIARGELGTVLVILTMASMTAAVLWQLSQLRLGRTFQTA
jgi:fumarate reductase subunit D